MELVPDFCELLHISYTSKTNTYFGDRIIANNDALTIMEEGLFDGFSFNGGL